MVGWIVRRARARHRPGAAGAVDERPIGPAAMPPGLLLPVGIGNSLIAPAGVIRPILLLYDSVNQRLPSGPAAMSRELLLAVVIGNSVITPAVVMRPILLLYPSVNQRLPSGPATIA